MGLISNKKQPIYVNVKEGKFNYRVDDEKVEFNALEGELTDIYVKEHEVNDQTMKFWKFRIYNSEDDDEAVLSVYYDGSFGRTLLNNLASAESIGEIRIEVWKKGKYTQMAVFNDGEKLKWKYEYSELPPPKTITLNGNELKDYSDMIAFFDRVAEDVKGKLSKALPENESEIEDDLDFEEQEEQTEQPEVLGVADESLDDVPF